MTDKITILTEAHILNNVLYYLNQATTDKKLIEAHPEALSVLNYFLLLYNDIGESYKKYGDLEEDLLKLEPDHLCPIIFKDNLETEGG